MKWFKKIFHPLFAFIGIQLVWGLVVFFWIYWFVGRHRGFRELEESDVSVPVAIRTLFSCWEVPIEKIYMCISNMLTAPPDLTTDQE